MAHPQGVYLLVRVDTDEKPYFIPVGVGMEDGYIADHVATRTEILLPVTLDLLVKAMDSFDISVSKSHPYVLLRDLKAVGDPAQEVFMATIYLEQSQVRGDEEEVVEVMIEARACDAINFYLVLRGMKRDCSIYMSDKLFQKCKSSAVEVVTGQTEDAVKTLLNEAVKILTGLKEAEPEKDTKKKKKGSDDVTP